MFPVSGVPPEHIKADLIPISLTAVLCKQMEEFVVKWVLDIVQDRIDPNQYGSIKKSSTTHALVDLLHQCYTSTDASKQYAGILLLDFSKAFDLINQHSSSKTCKFWPPEYFNEVDRLFPYRKNPTS